MNIESKRQRIIEALTVAAARPQPIPEAIAIVGLSGFFPNSMSVTEFWQALDDDRSLIEEVPPSRFDWRRVSGLNGDGSRSRIRWGGFIPDIRGFDASFFGILPEDAQLMDPRRRLLLMSVYQTLEDAGYAPTSLKKSRTGVYVAAEENEYLQLLLEKGVAPGAGFGQASSMIANHISYHFDFRGPSEFVSAMCAGGAVAIHRAVKDLRSGEIDQAVVGAANLLLQPHSSVHLAGMGQLSSRPTVGSFGKSAEGYLRAEAVASILLKPLSRAELDGDSVYAIIRNSAVNFNGRDGTSIAAPNIAAHTEVIQRCYREAGADPRDIGYIEAQGMGNPATDIAEWEAFNRALEQIAGERHVSLTALRCGVSSLKPIAGHMHAASAFGALFKIIRSFQTNRLPGIRDFGQAHPDLDVQDRPCRLLAKMETWPRSERARLAGLHSYGSGGNNAHLLLEEYAAHPSNRQAGEDPAGSDALILLSAQTLPLLREMCGRLKNWIGETPSIVLPDLAWTLQAGRDAMSERLAMYAASISELRHKLEGFLNGDEVSRCWFGRAEGSRNSSETDAASLSSDALAEAWVRGARVDWRQRRRNEVRRRLHAPCYPFDRKDWWFEQENHQEQMGEAEEFLNPLSDIEVEFLMKEFRVAGNHRNGNSVNGVKTDERPRSAGESARSSLSQKTISDAIRNVLTGTLKIDAAVIGPSGNFRDYGIDSINGTRFIQALEKSLDVIIPPKWMFDHPSIEELSRIIFRKIRLGAAN